MRIGISIVGFAVFPFVEHGPRVHPTLAYSLLVLGLVVPGLILRGHAKKRRSSLEMNVPWITSTVDTMLTLLWIFATGGVDSPWFVALYGSIVAVSLRQHPRESVGGAVLGGVGYVLLALSTGELLNHLAVVAVRVAMMGFLGAGAWAIAHERLRTLSSRLRLLDLTQEVGRIGTWEWSVENGTLAWSEVLYQLFGKDASFVPTFEGYLAAVHPDDRAALRSTIEQSLANHAPFLVNHRIVVGDEVRWVHCRGRVTIGSDGRITEMVGSSQDVTERHTMEAQLVLSEKFASLGTLASGIAHEINNPLAYVTTNLELLQRQVATLAEPEQDRLREAVAAARHGSARMRDIVRGLKTFSRADQDQLQSVDIARVADFALDVAGHAIAQRARVKREYETTPAVIANESRLTQVFVNLLVNAAHAIGAGAVADNEIRVRIGVEGGNRVYCSISDTGSGIAAEHLPRIFDPFYTTKPGEGTGLGLSICHGIVRDAGGDIAVTSTGPQGTTFTVSLPAAANEVAATAADVITPKPPSTRKRIVVIDDEKRYAESLRLLLGYDHDVALATSAELALELLAEDPAFDVIVCDLMMPGKTGMDLHAELEVSAPPLIDRMIFLTGGATTDRAREFLARPDIRHLEKPVELPTLEAMISEVVERRAVGVR